MAGGGRIGGQGSMVQRGIWIFIACCIVVAMWNTFPHDPKGFARELGHKSEQLKGVATSVVDWMGLDNLGGGDSETPDKTENQDAPAKKSGPKSASK